MRGSISESDKLISKAFSAQVVAAVLGLLCLSVPSLGLGDKLTNIENLATKRVQPEYPPLAVKYHLEGTVRVNLKVSPEGKVVEAEFAKGHNIFRSVSLDAAKRWEFKAPRDADGNPATLAGYITFTFRLK